MDKISGDNPVNMSKSELLEFYHAENIILRDLINEIHTSFRAWQETKDPLKRGEEIMRISILFDEAGFN